MNKQITSVWAVFRIDGRRPKLFGLFPDSAVARAFIDSCMDPSAPGLKVEKRSIAWRFKWIKSKTVLTVIALALLCSSCSTCCWNHKTNDSEMMKVIGF